MKDKNTVIGWLLIALVFIGFAIYNSHEAKKRAQQQQAEQITEAIAQQKSDSLAQANAQQELQTILAQQQDSTNLLFQARQGKEGATTLQNELLKVSIDNEGGQVARVELLDPTYRNQQGGNVVLFDRQDTEMQLLFEGKEVNILTDDFCFTPTEVSDSSVCMMLPVGSGAVRIRYTLVPQSYLLRMDVQAEGLGGLFSAKTKTLDIRWTEKMRQQEKGYSFENRYSTITYRRLHGGTKELSASGSNKEKEGEKLKNPMRWVAYKTQFFSQVLIADSLLTVQRMSSKQEEQGSGYLKTYDTEMSTFFDPSGETPTRLAFYFGPNKFSTLKSNEKTLNSKDDLDLQTIVYLGWPILRWINRYIFLYLFDFMTGWGINMGIVLLLITLIVKCAVFPLMRKSYLSSANMRVLRPKVDEIAKQYPNPEDAMQKQQAMMQLYAEYGVSPMGGCLPMLIQMPIWIALFNFIPNAIELRGQSFLWANDLSTYDDLIHWGFRIWGIGDHISLFCILWCASTIANTIISMRQQSYAMTPEQEQSMKMMKWMSYLMPVIFFFSFNSYSSGLNYYYFISGLLTILMMWYLRRSTDDAKLLAKLEARHKERKANPKKNGGGSMMSRLQKMAEQQQEILRQQQEQQQHKKR